MNRDRIRKLTILIFVLMMFTSCNTMPVVKIGEFTWPEKHTISQKGAVEAAVHHLLAQLLTMVKQKDFSTLPAHVSQERGLWVDLKSHWSYAELLQQVNHTEGYLQSFYFDTDLLRLQSGDPERLALRDVLKESRQIEANIYMEAGGEECEVKLHLVERPELNYHLNNPVFVKENDTWKIYRLF